MTNFHFIAKGTQLVAPFSHAGESHGWVTLTGQMPSDPAASEARLPEGVTALTVCVFVEIDRIARGPQ